MLAGNLDEFTLPDLFQLLGLTKKSGALRITHDGAEGRIYFTEGEVYFAQADHRRLPLGARLVGGGHLPAERLQQLLRDHRGGSAVEVVADLWSSGQIDEAVLNELLHEQLQDALFSLLRLEEGEFAFDGEAGVDWAGPRYEATQALEEAHRRIDEWGVLSAHVPAPKSVLSLAPNPPGAAPLALERDQWHVVALVDGKRTVADVVELSGKGEFRAGRVIADLVEAGLVEVHDRPGEGTLAALLAGRHALRQLEEVALGAGHTARSPAGGHWPEQDDLEPTVTPGLDPAEDASVGVLTGRRPSWDPEDLEAEASAEDEDEAPAAPVLTAVSEEPEDPAGTPDDAIPADEAAAADDAADDDDDDDADAEDEATAVPAPDDARELRLPEAARGAAHPLDRAQVARELASLALDDGPAKGPRRGAGDAAARPGRPQPPSQAQAVHRPGPVGADRLTRDEDVNRRLLLRLIDGVKGA